MPRKSRRKAPPEPPAAEPTPLSAVLEPMAERLSLPEPAAQTELKTPEPEPQKPGPHAAAVLAARVAPPPAGFRGRKVYPQTGIRVSQSDNKRVAALLFAEGRPLSRALEYDLMEEVQRAGFQYQPSRRQWERQAPENKTPFDNLMDAVALADRISAARDVGRGR